MVFHLGTLMPSAREAPPSCRLPPITGGRRSYHLPCYRLSLSTTSQPEYLADVILKHSPQIGEIRNLKLL